MEGQVHAMPAGVTPDAIDLGFAPRPVADLVVTQVGDEQVLIGGAARIMVLNPTGALVFQFLDGEATIGELVDDLSDALGVDADVVETDVLAFVRGLGGAGLLEGVHLPEPEPFDWGGWEPPPPPAAPGDELSDFTLLDLDGNARSLSEFRGRQVLLVNWSPTCGFCTRIAATLGALEAPMHAEGVDLVLLAAGDADANRAVVVDGGLLAPVLLRDGTETDPFGGIGTPAAFLLDADGRVARDMVVGADQVPRLAGELAGVDPVDPDEPADVGPDGVRYLPAPGAMCGPGGGAGGHSTDWQGTRAYRVGEYHVGVRFNSEATAETLDQLFTGARVRDGRVPDNYSVALTLDRVGAAGARELDLLVRGATQLVRSRAPGRVLSALLTYLSEDLGRVDDTGLTRVAATALVRDGRAHLLPPGLVNFVKELQPRWSRAGLAMVDAPATRIDLAGRELVVVAPGIPHDESLLAELDAEASLGSELPRVRPGRYPLDTWFLARSPDAPPLSPAVAVTTALGLVTGIDDLEQAVGRFAELFSFVDARPLWYTSARELVDEVRAALD